MKEGYNLKKNTFIYSTFILVIANFFIRFLGFVYKVLLSRFLGSEGIGLFHLVFHVFLITITISSSGIPVAVSKIVAQKKSLGDLKGCEKTLFISLTLGLCISIIISFAMYLHIDYILNRIIKNNKLYASMGALIPALPIVTLSSIIRGYYYGIKNVTPAAHSQIVEQLTRIIFVIGVLYFIGPKNLEVLVSITALGISIGELSGLILLVLKLNRSNLYFSNYSTNYYNSSSSISILVNILLISIPITIARLVAVLMQSANMFLVPLRLQSAGLTIEQSVSTFGEVVGMTMPLLFLPFIVTSALVVNIIPNISEEKALKKWTNIKSKSLLALRVGLLISIPIGFIYYFFPEPISNFLYNNPRVGLYLKYLSPTVIFLSLHHISAGILHGMGKQIVTTINYLIGTFIHLICIYFLVSIPDVGINGFIIGFILSTLIMFTLNFYRLKKYLVIKLSILNHILKPIIASVLMIISILISDEFLFLYGLNKKLCTMISFIIGGICYLIIILLIKSIKLQTIYYILNSKK